MKGGGGGVKGVERKGLEMEEVEREEGGGRCEERRQGMDDNSKLMTEI